MAKEILDREMGAFRASSWEEGTVGSVTLSRKDWAIFLSMGSGAYSDV